MNDGTDLPPPAAVPSATNGFWARFWDTFGPAVAGLVGGGLMIGLTLAATEPLLRNAAATYASYPSLQPPGLIRDVSVPNVVLVPLVLLGLAAPFAMGLATAWLVRGRDRWGEVSAALTTGLSGSFAAYLLGIGWAVNLAFVVVPSIADLTLFGESTKAPADAGAQPSDVLVRQYPDLKDTPADARGGLFFPKIVSDQVAGCAYGVWMGVGLSLATVGVVGFVGTLVGGRLLRRGASLRSAVGPYLELTGATSVAAGRLIVAAAVPGESLSWLRAVCLVAATALVVAGAVGRWPALLRVTCAAAWVLVLFGSGLDGRGRVPAPVAYAAYGLLAFLLVRHRFAPGRRPDVAPA